ncbi:cobalt ECF transporter T component CbiQ [Methanobrevibacter curvatus]|uniref:Energy-coupling factor transporter transmembrane protein EcfT n=1 Tax=Methanobrevibacter curvatus TaxID=49547 RepID=A0A166DUJ7_9EURY|nr:cobalt ECF transporter T component CbiQ [Methanobrevibacter curvatus]KZX15966.1 energy-coupling factor transporter transmembrane protein EcfT [Methanobrevibacter curvatus]
MNINEALDLDALSSQNSIVHNLEGRIKLIAVLVIIVFTVYSNQLLVPVVMEIFLLIMIFLANLSFINSFKRIALLLPFGGFIILFQPFIHPGAIIWQSSVSWLHITDLGLNWAILLAARLIVSLTAIVLLSSTSPVQEIVQSFRKLGMPKDLAMILSIMVRFLFVFIDELSAIRTAQKSRNFNIHSKLTPYKWRIKQVGYTIGMMFLKAFEKGENVYFSMISRCFSDNSQLYSSKKNINLSDYSYLALIIILMAILQVTVMFFNQDLGYLGIVLYS